MKIKITTTEHAAPVGKLANAELHFTDGPLAGLKLIGFAVWERRGGSGRNVTFPARQYSINGERRSFALLRPTERTSDQDRVRDLILSAYAAFEAGGSEIYQAPAQAEPPAQVKDTPQAPYIPPQPADGRARIGSPTVENMRAQAEVSAQAKHWPQAEPRPFDAYTPQQQQDAATIAAQIFAQAEPPAQAEPIKAPISTEYKPIIAPMPAKHTPPRFNF